MAPKRKISGALLLSRLKAVMKREFHAGEVLVGDPLTDYFDSIPMDVIGFGPTLNDSEEFSSDYLGLMPRHLKTCHKIGNLHAVIKQWYSDHGWTVT
jgi:hypothetical protein